ncbi:MAG: class I SAM-dependent methyltransferase [Candidatus Methanomethylophilaceae archaeon]|jgi:SAM-dependent methyltransferase
MTSETWSKGEMTGKDAKERWNKRSDKFADMKIPEKDDGYISLILETSGNNLKEKDILDIGCGSGRWSMALADEVRSVVGVDIADKMIGHANDKASSEGFNNTKYIAADWKEPGLDLGQQKFGIVMAHMTPAINSDEDLIRMDSACDGYCYFTSSIKGENDLREKIEEHFKVSFDRDRRALSNALRVLFDMGRKPLIRYDERIHDKKETVEDIMGFYRETAVSKGVSEKDLEEFLNSIAVDGIIESKMTMTKATLYWSTAE